MVLQGNHYGLFPSGSRNHGITCHSFAMRVEVTLNDIRVAEF